MRKKKQLYQQTQWFNTTIYYCKREQWKKKMYTAKSDLIQFILLVCCFKGSLQRRKKRELMFSDGLRTEPLKGPMETATVIVTQEERAVTAMPGFKWADCISVAAKVVKNQPQSLTSYFHSLRLVIICPTTGKGERRSARVPLFCMASHSLLLLVCPAARCF